MSNEYCYIYKWTQIKINKCCVKYVILVVSSLHPGLFNEPGLICWINNSLKLLTDRHLPV